MRPYGKFRELWSDAVERYKGNFRRATAIANKVAPFLPPSAYPILSLVNFANGDFKKWAMFRNLANSSARRNRLLLTR